MNRFNLRYREPVTEWCVRFGAFLVLLCASQSLQAASQREQGAAAFHRGDFAKSVEHFSEVVREQPGNHRALYELGIAQAAVGKLDDAAQTLRNAALSPEQSLQILVLPILGDVEVRRALSLLTSNPAETEPTQRTQVLEYLQHAEEAYSEAVTLTPNDEKCRTNLEQIRAWRTRMTAEWQDADQAKKRQESSLPDRFRDLENWQRDIRAKTKQAQTMTASPKKYQTLYDLAKEQHRLGKEIPPLQETFTRQIQDDPDTPPQFKEQSVSAIAAECQRLSQSTQNIESALREFSEQKSIDAASQAVSDWNLLRTALSPFEAIVSDATTSQEKLCAVNNDETPKSRDFAEQAWEQGMVARQVPVFVAKAEQGLQSKMDTAEPPEMPDQEKALRESMRLAVQYGPEIETLTSESAELLRQHRPDEAKPKQARALELLKEILKPLEEQQQNQQQNQQNQDKNKEGEQKQQNDDQQRSENGNENKPENQRPQEGEEQESQNPSEGSDAEGERESQTTEQTAEERKAEQEKAARMIRAVKLRQQEAEERRERVRAILMQSQPAAKDW